MMQDSGGKRSNAPAGDAGKGDKSLSWAGSKTIDKEPTRSSTPTLSSPGTRVA